MKENSASLASLIWTVMNLGAGGGGYWDSFRKKNYKKN